MVGISSSDDGRVKTSDGQLVSAANPLPVDAHLEVGDIKIGAVEIQDLSADTRASVEARGAKGALAVEILDASGNQITTFGSSSVTVNNSTGAAAVNIQDGGNTITVDGSVNVGTVTTLPSITGSVSVSNMIPAVETGLATSAKQLPDGHSVSVSNMIPAVETGLATSAKQLADGHNVTVDNSTGASAVNIQDGGNTITVDGTVAATTVKPDGTNTMPSLDTVDRAGFFKITDGVDIATIKVASGATAPSDYVLVIQPIDKNGNVIGQATATISEYNITLTLVDTEYSQALPTNCKGFEFQCRTNADIRYAFTTGKVAIPTAPWFTLNAGNAFSKDSLDLASKTIYFAGDAGGEIVELICWS
jgi:hypothetical protein